MKKVYLVFEQGSGIIHHGFFEKDKAEAMIKKLEEQTDMECYEILEVNVE